MTAGAGTSLRIAVLADTHMLAGGRDLPTRAWDVVRGADMVLHAGDVVDSDLLDRLGNVAPTHAVLGNNDRALTGSLPDTVELELAGVALAMVHDSGPSTGRAVRMQRRFPRALVVVFGHSHIPVDEWAPTGQLLFNPGSPMQRRRQPHHTMGELVLGDGQVLDHRIVRLDGPLTPTVWTP